jgi:hypothetical protein
VKLQLIFGEEIRNKILLNYMKKLFEGIGYLTLIAIGLLLLLGLTLFVCEDIFNVSPHLYFTKYK